jgi:predicted nucleotidyltransferase
LQFLNFVVDYWLTIGSGVQAQKRTWFLEASKISADRKRIIGSTIRTRGKGDEESDIDIQITIQEVRNYQDAISHEEISTKNFGKLAYVVLNLTQTAAEDPLKALKFDKDGKPSALPLKEAIRRFTILSVDSLIRLARSEAEFKDPRTRTPITSVHKIYFILDEERVGPREAEKLAKVQAEVLQSLKRPRSSSLGGGMTYFNL